MEDFTALDASTALLRGQFARIEPHHWDEPSACEGWSVYDVANHVLGGGHRYLLWLTWAPQEQVEATRDLTFVGDDPCASLDVHATALRAAFEQAGAIARTVPHPAAGRISGHRLLQLRVLEQTLHAWDIGVGINSDTQIEPSLCEYLLGTTKTIERLRERGHIGEAITTEGSASAQAQLLRLTGRAWRHHRP